MKLTALAFLLSATAAFAGSTEAITGCATAPAENSNFTVRVDPTCALHSETSGSSILSQAAYAAWVDIVTPDDEDE